jgi:RNA-directed DNA polymerase
MSQMKERKAPPVSKGTTSETWNSVPWKKLEQHCFRIQKRIYRASQRGNQRAVHKLQKLLMKSEAARMLAVRRVTQENQGKKTAGVDGVKSVKPKERLLMAQQIHPKHWKHGKAQPVRRVWIPKPGKDERRPLGIPTMHERARQCLAKLALEPEWEARFEANSYGFRPARSAHDALDAIFNGIRYKAKFVLDADLKACFDNINQEALLNKLHTYTAMKQAVKGWLKAGVLEDGVFAPTEAGTPQGGTISPLLANIALQGMEEAILSKRNRKHVEQPILIRYADDYVVLHSDLEKLRQAEQKLTDWLADMGLHMNPKKTRITHTLTPHEGNVGFDFLGFSVRQFPVGKTHTGKNTYGKPLGFKTIIRPSKEAIKRHILTLNHRMKKMRSYPQWKVIKELNPVIWGWSNYYRTVVSSDTFSACDRHVWFQLQSWARRRHPRKKRSWIDAKYWKQVDGRDTFCTPLGAKLRLHRDTAIQRHKKVRGTTSPYDGNLLYWSQRLKAHPLMHARKAKLLQKQQGKCRWCELLFRDEDILEIDHIDQNHSNNKLSNLMLLHLHCHDQRHSKLTKTIIKEKTPKKREKKSENKLPDGYSQKTWDAEMAVLKERIRKLEREGISIK